MANIKSIGGNPIVLGLDGLTDEAKSALYNGTLCAASDSLLGTPATDTWATRTSAGSGAARVESVQGAAEVQDGELVPVTIAGISSTDAQGGELDSVEWTTQTLRAAGSVADMLYSDHVDVRVGVVDLGTLAWVYDSNNQYFACANLTTRALGFSTLKCAKYETASSASTANLPDKQIVGGNSSVTLYIKDSSYTNAAAFKASLDGVMLYYALATPTTQTISPALPMTYRVEQDGTESIIVPDGEVSAAPVLTVAEGESAADLVMAALACIAAPDGPTATANHAVNTYLTMQGKLYKVTSAIASGEQIVSGTNVTETTVMAELLALAN